MKDELPKLRKTKKMETNIVYKKTFDSVASLQAARQNRATLRKLAFASEGSDMLRFNLHKVGKSTLPSLRSSYKDVFSKENFV